MWRPVDPSGWVSTPCPHLEVFSGMAKIGHISESVPQRSLFVHTLLEVMALGSDYGAIVSVF